MRCAACPAGILDGLLQDHFPVPAPGRVFRRSPRVEIEKQKFFPLRNNKLCSCVFLFIQMRHFPISVLPSIFRDQFLSFSWKMSFFLKKEKRKPCNNIIALWVMILNSLWMTKSLFLEFWPVSGRIQRAKFP